MWYITWYIRDMRFMIWIDMCVIYYEFILGNCEVHDMNWYDCDILCHILDDMRSRYEMILAWYIMWYIVWYIGWYEVTIWIDMCMIYCMIYCVIHWMMLCVRYGMMCVLLSCDTVRSICVIQNVWYSSSRQVCLASRVTVNVCVWMGSEWGWGCPLRRKSHAGAHRGTEAMGVKDSPALNPYHPMYHPIYHIHINSYHKPHITQYITHHITYISIHIMNLISPNISHSISHSALWYVSTFSVHFISHTYHIISLSQYITYVSRHITVYRKSRRYVQTK